MTEFLKTIAEVQEQDKHAAVVARLRSLATELEWANDLYLYHREYGMWNPANARYEADYLERNP